MYAYYSERERERERDRERETERETERERDREMKFSDQHFCMREQFIFQFTIENEPSAANDLFC